MAGKEEQGNLTRTRLALGMAVFGSATPVSKIVTGAMPVFVGSALRVGLGAVVLAPFAWKARAQVREFERRDWITVCLIALFGMFGFSALMLYGMKMIPGVVGAIVMSTAPAVTAAASMLFFGDSPTWRKLTAIAFAVAGVLLLQLGQGSGEGSGSEMWLGAALVFAAVCCEACYTLLGKRMSEHIDPVLVAFLAAALSIPLFLPFAIWQLSGFDVASVGAGAWAAAIWYGAGTLSLGTWLWYSGLARAEGAVAAAFMGVMPASALILSYVLLGEEFRWVHMAGFGTVFAGVLLVSWEHARMEKEG
ncbi:DMT family transporter [Parvibaculum sp.]|uniref:DMT family transporter n=1 Tax=Parvibaculum sp. TaxID=2024848 RepID=UPI001B1FD058|nr:DMT family transporter [Parvibaculum sp.]MBO6635312.1 DMT family transporter [Parvibaculum sp.]MBO6678285.1 DMT family transporter [Parvibaculum sp.]MBO6684500.1 DMT family transporter [Parvibaculum sp.]